MEKVVIHNCLGNVALCGAFNCRKGNKQEEHNVNFIDDTDVNDVISIRNIYFLKE